MSVQVIHPQHDRKILIHRAVFPLLLVTVLWLVKIAEVLFDLRLSTYGLYPLELKGLRGILFAPFIHGSWEHLFNNLIPLFFLTWALNYFYHEIFSRVFALLFFIHTFWLWFFGRDAFHIGASGLIYGLGAFLFVSGLIRKNSNLLAIAMVVAFLYGSMVWGVFPLVEEVSWEGHLTGMVAGIFLAFYYRQYGPPANMQRWKHLPDDEDEDIPGGSEYWEQIEDLEDRDRKPINQRFTDTRLGKPEKNSSLE